MSSTARRARPRHTPINSRTSLEPRLLHGVKGPTGGRVETPGQGTGLEGGHHAEERPTWELGTEAHHPRPARGPRVRDPVGESPHRGALGDGASRQSDPGVLGDDVEELLGRGDIAPQREEVVIGTDVTDPQPEHLGDKGGDATFPVPDGYHVGRVDCSHGGRHGNAAESRFGAAGTSLTSHCSPPQLDQGQTRQSPNHVYSSNAKDDFSAGSGFWSASEVTCARSCSGTADCSTLRNSPQCLHFLATARTVSPQNGQDFKAAFDCEVSASTTVSSCTPSDM